MRLIATDESEKTMSTIYRGTINLDYTDAKGKSYETERLKNALVQSGWCWVETSAFVIETPDLAKVWRGIDLIARQSSAIGQLSALTFHIQSSKSFIGIAPKTAAHHAQALTLILGKSFPSP